MKRREFARVAGGTAMVAGGGWSVDALAQNLRPQAGTDYLELDPRAPVEAPAGKVEVVEFFWYSCPHCNAFEPTLAAWLKQLPREIAFRRVPVSFRDDFLPQQRLYYALEAMGLLDKLHAKVFAAIHVEKQNLAQASAIFDWVSKQGVDRTKFVEQFNSFSVATKANRGTQLQNSYKVEGVPALGVAGRYYVDGQLANGMERALKVVEALVADVRGGK